MVRFTLASLHPIEFEYAGTVHQIPRFTRKDWRDWAQRVDAEREDKATAGLTPAERARTLLVYPVVPITKAELQQRVGTIEGSGHVFRTCANRAQPPLPPGAIDELCDGDAVDEDQFQSLAVALASIVDPEEVAARQQAEIRRRKQAIKEMNEAYRGDPKADGDGNADVGAFVAANENAEDESDPLSGGRAASATSPGGIGM